MNATYNITRISKCRISVLSILKNCKKFYQAKTHSILRLNPKSLYNNDLRFELIYMNPKPVSKQSRMVKSQSKLSTQIHYYENNEVWNVIHDANFKNSRSNLHNAKNLIFDEFSFTIFIITRRHTVRKLKLIGYNSLDSQFGYDPGSFTLKSNIPSIFGNIVLWITRLKTPKHARAWMSYWLEEQNDNY